jgi:hypothetical protein
MSWVLLTPSCWALVFGTCPSLPGSEKSGTPCARMHREKASGLAVTELPDAADPPPDGGPMLATLGEFEPPQAATPSTMPAAPMTATMTGPARRLLQRRIV